MKRDEIANIFELFIYLGEQLISKGFQEAGSNHYYLVNNFFNKISVTITKSPIGGNTIDCYDLKLNENKIRSFGMSGGILVISTIMDFPNDNVPYFRAEHQIELVDMFIDDIFKNQKVKMELRKIKLKKINDKILNK